MRSQIRPVFPGMAGVVGRYVARLAFPFFMLLSSVAWAVEVSQDLTLGVLAYRGKDRAISEWQATADYLSRALPSGYRVRVLPLFLEEVEPAVARRELDFVLTNPENYVVLEARYHVTRNATLLKGNERQPLKEFGGLIFKRADARFGSTLTDLKGHRVAAASPQAFGAYQMQLFELVQAGLEPAEIKPVFVGLPMENIVAAVAEGRADVGFIRAGLLESMAEAGQIRLGDFQGIALKKHDKFPYMVSTALYPEWAFAALPHIDEGLANQITIALLSLPHGGEVAKQGQYYGWAVPLSYEPVHKLMKMMHAPPYDGEKELSLREWLRQYSVSVMLVLIAILVLLGYFVQRFFRLNRALTEQRSNFEKLASFDVLTGLPNRGLLADRLGHGLSQAKRNDQLLAICFLDLDGFKAVNDTLGHDIGDALLREVAWRLTADLRAGDTVARLGGDEFVLLLHDIKDIEELDGALQRILVTVSDPYLLAGQQVRISTSIGVTVYPFDDADADMLIQHADQAMYRAKQDGRNRYNMFDTDYAKLKQDRFQLRERVKQVLQRQELVLHYQPRVRLREQRVDGVEALLRWQHPDKGLLLPGLFLPVIEHDDLICMIGAWALREALNQQQRWQAEGIALAVSVNVAARQFLDPRFMIFLENLLAEFPDRMKGGLELEILESADIEDTRHVVDVISRCHRLGVRFALDDFGTGYSSLSYLQRLPADTLKIDRSFVNGMLTSRSSLAIIEAVIGLAGAFQCELVAEGIETMEQGELLVRLGCEEGQGFMIARPMPADQIPGWLRSYRTPASWLSWANVRLGSQDFPLLLAEFEHRCWVKNLVDATTGKNLITPIEAINDPTRCEFGRWLEHRGRNRYGKYRQMAEVDQVHRAVHDLGQVIHQHLVAGEVEQARSRVADLESLSGQLIEALGRLQRGNENDIIDPVSNV
ncbi:MAG: EAL domain-containing protein [Sulfuricellaceae bacterium]|nr:EAL domain-containing protein [Sulfuricellaceae bacterium]